MLTGGCTQGRREKALRPTPAKVVVVAPVLNLSGSDAFDPLWMTDLIASEFRAFDDIAVIPVNLTLAELERRGKFGVETPDDARALAEAFGADATIVTAVTEYDPYDPPTIGLIMQWYALQALPARAGFDPVSASRAVTDAAPVAADAQVVGPQIQLQRVFHAADHDVCDEIRTLAEQRGAEPTPYGWKKYTKSQELYVRYCGWSLIRTMLRLDASQHAATEPNEAQL
jgi:hypothetical protein